MTTTIQEYELLTPETCGAYIASRPELEGRVDVATLDVQEIGDGNLNLVFLCKDASGGGVVLKQALPYVRLIGPSWPFTPLRAAAEARAYAAHGEWAPEYVPELYLFDSERFILAVEDLSDHRVWRGALNDGEVHEAAAEAMGRYVGRVAFRTGVFGVEAKRFKRLVEAAINPDLCEITEDLVLTEPFSGAERNWHVDGLEAEVERFRTPEVLRAAGEMKLIFMTRAEALVHGDLHTGSVMVHPDGSTRAFDQEFCYYGPVGMDIGLLWANFICSQARDHVLGRSDHETWVRSLYAAVWAGFEAETRALWPERVDPRVFTDDVLEAWLAQVRADSAGFAACEAARRVVGLAHVTDLETLEEADRLRAASGVLRTVKRLIVSRSELPSAEAVGEWCAEALAS